MKTYVVHYDKLIERKKYMDSQLQKYNLPCEYVSNYGKDKLTLSDKNRFRNISDAEISVCLHHIECFKKIATGNNEFSLILEDDVILCNNFKNTLDTYVSNLPLNWDMLFIGDGCGLHISNDKIQPNVYIYSKDNLPSSKYGLGATRCLDSYLITKKCAQKIVEKLTLPNYTILCPADHWLNHVIRNNKFNVYWSEPTIVTQGSEKKIFISSIR
jgi:GR25 family glycosyltransferase involved in LPS biosynthesis